MAGDPRTLLPDRFFGNLHQNFLPLFQQVGNLWNVLWLTALEAASTTASAPTMAIESRPLRPLGVPGSRSRRTNLDPSIHCAISTRFGVESSFGFRLSLVQFGLLFCGFVDFFFGFRS